MRSQHDIEHGRAQARRDLERRARSISDVFRPVAEHVKPYKDLNIRNMCGQLSQDILRSAVLRGILEADANTIRRPFRIYLLENPVGAAEDRVSAGAYSADLELVKPFGKPMPDLRRKGYSALFS